MFRGDGSRAQNLKIDGIVSTVLSGVVAQQARERGAPWTDTLVNNR